MLQLTASFLLQLLQYDFSLSPVIIRMMQLTAVGWVRGLDLTPIALQRPQLVVVTAADQFMSACSAFAADGCGCSDSRGEAPMRSTLGGPLLPQLLAVPAAEYLCHAQVSRSWPLQLSLYSAPQSTAGGRRGGRRPLLRRAQRTNRSCISLHINNTWCA